MKKAKRGLRLLSDRVMVRIVSPERMSHGLWIPDSAERDDWDLYRGEVVACGPGRRNKFGALTPVEVVPGDKVLCNWFAMAKGKGMERMPGPLDHVFAQEAGHYVGDCVVVRETDIRLVYDA